MSFEGREKKEFLIECLEVGVFRLSRSFGFDFFIFRRFSRFFLEEEVLLLVEGFCFLLKGEGYV